MATPSSSISVIRVNPEIEALKLKLQEIDEYFNKKEKTLLEREEDFVKTQKVRKEEFDLMKSEEMRKLQEQKEQFQLFQDQQKHLLLWEKEALSKEKEDFEQSRRRAEAITGSQDTVLLEVGNDKFRTQSNTLARCKGSIFPRLVENLKTTHNESRIFIDRDGKHFKFVLNFMRMGERVMRGPVMKNIDKYILEEILAEAEYYKLQVLERLLRRKLLSIEKSKIDFTIMLNAKYFLKCNPPTQSAYTSSNEIVVKNSNLDKITFEHIEFRHPVTFDTCTMIKARFSNCRFSSTMRFNNVDLEGVHFQNCIPKDVAKQLFFIDTDHTTIVYSPPCN